MSSAPTNPDLLTLAAQIVSAHVAHNAVPVDTLPRVIQSVYATLSGLENPPPPVEAPGPRTAGRGRRRSVRDGAPIAAPDAAAPKAARGKRGAASGL